jgi:thioredoxin 1
MSYLPYVILGLVLLGFLAFQVIPWVQARRMRGVRLEDLDPDIAERLEIHDRLLLYFWSPNCGLCRRVTPVIDRLMDEREDVVKIDVTQRLDLAKRMGVLGTPALLTICNCSVEKLVLGARTEDQIRAMLERAPPRRSARVQPRRPISHRPRGIG